MVVSFPTKDTLLEEVEQLGYSEEEAIELVQAANEIGLDSMLAFQALYQTAWADNAVSFTVNVQDGMHRWHLEETLKRWLPMLKGTTVMVDGTRKQAPYERITRGLALSAGWRRHQDAQVPPHPRPAAARGAGAAGAPRRAEGGSARCWC